MGLAPGANRQGQAGYWHAASRRSGDWKQGAGSGTVRGGWLRIEGRRRGGQLRQCAGPGCGLPAAQQEQEQQQLLLVLVLVEGSREGRGGAGEGFGCTDVLLGI